QHSVGHTHVPALPSVLRVAARRRAGHGSRFRDPRRPDGPLWRGVRLRHRQLLGSGRSIDELLLLVQLDVLLERDIVGLSPFHGLDLLALLRFRRSLSGEARGLPLAVRDQPLLRDPAGALELAIPLGQHCGSATNGRDDLLDHLVRTRVPLGQPYSLDRALAHHPAEKTRSYLSVSHCRHVRPPPAVEEHCALPALGIAMAYGEVDGELREAVLATHLEPFSLKSLGEIVANRVLDPCC